MDCSDTSKSRIGQFFDAAVNLIVPSKSVAYGTMPNLTDEKRAYYQQLESAPKAPSPSPR